MMNCVRLLSPESESVASHMEVEFSNTKLQPETLSPSKPGSSVAFVADIADDRRKTPLQPMSNMLPEPYSSPSKIAIPRASCVYGASALPASRAMLSLSNRVGM